MNDVIIKKSKEVIFCSCIDSSTVSVILETQKKHPKYHKILSRKKKFLVHVDELYVGFDKVKNLKSGDRLFIQECRPKSAKKKHFICNI